MASVWAEAEAGFMQLLSECGIDITIGGIDAKCIPSFTGEEREQGYGGTRKSKSVRVRVSTTDFPVIDYNTTATIYGSTYKVRQREKATFSWTLELVNDV